MESTTSAKRASMHNYGKKGWLMIVYLFLLYIVVTTSTDMLNVAPFLWQGIMGWDPYELLSYGSVAGWVSVFVSIGIGVWARNKGARIPTAIGLLLGGVFMIINGFAISQQMYMLAFVAHTCLANAVCLAIPNIYAANWWPTRKGMALGWATMGMPVEGMFCIALFTGLFNMSGGMKIPYAVFGAMTLVVGIITLFVKEFPEEAGAYPDNIPQSKEQSDATYKALREYKSPWTVKKLLTNPQVWLLIVVFGTQFMCLMSCVMQFIPRFSAQTDISGNPLFNMDELIGFYVMTNAFGIVGSYLFGWIDQKIGTKKATVILGVYLFAVVGVGLLWWNSRILSIIDMALIGIMVGAVGNIFVSQIIQFFGREDFTAANTFIVPVVALIRTSVFMLQSFVLSSNGYDYKGLVLVFTGIAFVSMILTFFLKPGRLILKNEN